MMVCLLDGMTNIAATNYIHSEAMVNVVEDGWWALNSTPQAVIKCNYE